MLRAHHVWQLGFGTAVATVPDVADVSARLRAARQRAGLTIDDISVRTKIKPTMLIALERGAFEELPGEFFARAFLSTYARELKLPADEILAAYDAQRAGPAESPVAVVAVSPETNERSGKFRIPAPASLWPITALVVAILVIVLLMNRAPSEPDPDGTAAEEAVGTSGGMETPAAAAAPAAAPETLTIEIRPRRPLWVTAFADGERVLFRTLGPGERVVVDARQELRFRLGDAGAFEYTLNGRPATPPGRDGEVRDFTITRENYRSLIR